MAKQKTPVEIKEQISKVKDEIRQGENHINQLLQKKNVMERKERTRRLIERGAILESLITDAPALTNEQIKMLLQAALAPISIRNMANSLINGS